MVETISVPSVAMYTLMYSPAITHICTTRHRQDRKHFLGHFPHHVDQEGVLFLCASRR